MIKIYESLDDVINKLDNIDMSENTEDNIFSELLKGLVKQVKNIPTDIASLGIDKQVTTLKFLIRLMNIIGDSYSKSKIENIMDNSGLIDEAVDKNSLVNALAGIVPVVCNYIESNVSDPDDIKNIIRAFQEEVPFIKSISNFINNFKSQKNKEGGKYGKRNIAVRRKA